MSKYGTSSMGGEQQYFNPTEEEMICEYITRLPAKGKLETTRGLFSGTIYSLLPEE